MQGLLARALRLRAIPCGFAFSRDGVLFDERVGGFDIRDGATAELVRGWVRGSAGEHAPSRGVGDVSTVAAQELFAEGSAHWQRGERDEGLATWHAAYLRDPHSFVIRKQIWRALYPDRFDEPIDLAWQKEQIEREDRLGFAAANPGLPPPAHAHRRRG